MSKQVDPHNLTADDVEYIRQRPNLRREFEMNGFGDPLDPEYPGLVDGPSGEKKELSEDVVELQAQVETLIDQVQSLENENQVLRNALESDSDEESDDAAEGEESDEDLPAEKQWNDGMTKAELRAVIEARNADYDDDEKIEMPEDKKPALVAALEQDDAELSAED